MPANSRIQGNFPALKNLLNSNFKTLAEQSDEIFKTFGGIALKVVAFLVFTFVY